MEYFPSLYELTAPYPWLLVVATWISVLGSPEIIGILTVVGAVWLAGHRRRHLAIAMLVSVSVTALAVTSLKWSFLRVRPDHTFLSLIDDPSFPSGHAALAAVFFVMLGYSALKIHPHKSHKAGLSRLHVFFDRQKVIITVCVVAPLFIGLSRLVLHVHWPSDVLAGWALGLGVAGVTIFAAKHYS